LAERLKFEELRRSSESETRALTSAGAGSVPEPTLEASYVARVQPLPVPLPEEALRTATHLRLALLEGERLVAFTGLDEEDLASDVALGVAAGLSQVAPGKVVLVCAVPHPDQQNGPGLAEVLSGERGLGPALSESDPEGLFVLSAGRLPPNPLALFSTPECVGLFQALGERFRYVVVDAGPVLSPAAMMLISRCDAVATALAAGSHRRGEVLDIQRELARVRTRNLGIILTGKKR
jgi:hypothetical protein